MRDVAYNIEIIGTNVSILRIQNLRTNFINSLAYSFLRISTFELAKFCRNYLCRWTFDRFFFPYVNLDY